MEYYLIALTVTLVIAIAIKLFKHEPTLGPWYFQDANGNINGMVIYYERQKEQRYFDLSDGPGGKAILNDSLTKRGRLPS